MRRKPVHRAPGHFQAVGTTRFRREKNGENPQVLARGGSKAITRQKIEMNREANTNYRPLFFLLSNATSSIALVQCDR